MDVGTDPLKTWKDHGSNVANAGGVLVCIFLGKQLLLKEKLQLENNYIVIKLHRLF